MGHSWSGAFRPHPRNWFTRRHTDVYDGRGHRLPGPHHSTGHRSPPFNHPELRAVTYPPHAANDRSLEPNDDPDDDFADELEDDVIPANPAHADATDYADEDDFSDAAVFSDTAEFPDDSATLEDEDYDGSAPDPDDEDLPRFIAEGAPIVSDQTGRSLDDQADGSIAVDALLEALPGSDGEPTGMDALNHRLAEINSVLNSSRAAIAEEDESDVAEDDDPAGIDVETTNYDIGGISLDDPVRMYLREIGRVQLLTAAREVELASAMERGDYLVAKRAQLTNDFGEPPAPDVLGRAIYHSFREGWGHARALYAAVHGAERIPAKSLVLKRVLPITQLPEEAVAEVAARCGLAKEELEESLRVRAVE